MIYYFMYNLLLTIAFLIYSPVLLYKLVVKGEYRAGFTERLGYLAQGLEYLKNERVIWIHAASVGETGAASPLVNELRKEFPEHKFLFSTMTETGREMAQKVIEEADEFIYLPLDFPWIVKKVLKLLRPELIVIMETELWPNFIKHAKKFGARVMVASGRISDQSRKQYKYLGPLLKDVLSKVDLFSMQSQQDAKRIVELGAAKDKVYNKGNTKFDQEYGTTDLEAKERIYEEFKLNSEQPILVAGSTHQGEEEQLLSVYEELKAEVPELVLILAPRYVDRVGEIEQLYEEAGVEVVSRSKIATRDSTREKVILVDTIGELAQLYGVADLVFVGGSLIERGGHNILEPAAQGKLVLFGPHMFNFKDSTELLLEHGVGIQVADKDELAKELLYYLQHPEELRAKNKQAMKMIEKNQGAARRNTELAVDLLAGVAGTKGLNILFVRLSAIGDVIHALPAARAIRESYPRAEISWIVEEKAKDLVMANPHLDRVITLPKAEWKEKFKQEKWRTLKEVKEYFAELKQYEFDLVLDVHGLFKSGLPTYLSGAPRRVGPANGREGSTLFYNQKVEVPDKCHQVDRNLHLARAIGAESKEVKFDINISAAGKERVNRLFTDFDIYQKKSLVVINPFTSWQSKNWFKDRYARLADSLITQFDCEVIFTGGPADKTGVAEILDKMEEEAYNLAGKTSLKELAELYRRTDLFIGGDTGPMHLAVAMETPVVALMGPTTPLTHGPYGEDNIIIQKDIECKECWDRNCEDGTCMEEIRVADVLKAGEAMLKQEGIVPREGKEERHERAYQES